MTCCDLPGSITTSRTIVVVVVVAVSPPIVCRVPSGETLPLVEPRQRSRSSKDARVVTAAALARDAATGSAHLTFWLFPAYFGMQILALARRRCRGSRRGSRRAVCLPLPPDARIVAAAALHGHAAARGRHPATRSLAIPLLCDLMALLAAAAAARAIRWCGRGRWRWRGSCGRGEESVTACLKVANCLPRF